MAHITGGGIEGNLCRVIPDSLCAQIELNKLKPLPIFQYIHNIGNITDEEMLNTFNCGVGLIIVVSPDSSEHIMRTISKYYNCYEIGTIIKADKKILFKNTICW